MVIGLNIPSLSFQTELPINVLTVYARRIKVRKCTSPFNPNSLIVRSPFITNPLIRKFLTVPWKHSSGCNGFRTRSVREKLENTERSKRNDDESNVVIF